MAARFKITPILPSNLFLAALLCTLGGTTPEEALTPAASWTKNPGVEISTVADVEVSRNATMQASTSSAGWPSPLDLQSRVGPERPIPIDPPTTTTVTQTTTSPLLLPRYHGVVSGSPSTTHQRAKEESQKAEERGGPTQEEYYGEENEEGALDYWDVLRESQFSGFEASIEAALVDVDNERCREETREFLTGLRNLTLWATQMFDASVKYPLGILSGNVYNMGDFDECLSVRGPMDIRGRYCLARVDIREPQAAKARRLRDGPPGTQDPFAIWLHPMTSTWEQIEYKGARWRHRRDSAFWAMCVPSSCSAGDLQTVMSHVLPPLGSENGIDLEVTVHPQYCSVGSPPEGFGAADWVFCVVVAVLVGTSISATVFDFQRQQAESRPTPSQALFLCFSMRKNFSKLHQVTNKDGLKVMFGIRVLSMVMVILCHKYGVTIGGATTNGQYIEEGNRQIPYMLTLHGDLVVDTFFAVGAFLLAYSTLRDWDGNKGAGMGVMCFLRYLRLTPAYALVVFFYATVLSKLGSGPLWNSTVVNEAAFCARNWWANLLYISNYVNTQEMCMVHSWYLPCDMHYFLASLPLLLFLRRRRPWGARHALLALLAFASLAAPFVVTLTGGHDATILFYRDFLSNPRASRYFHAMYTKSHTRAGPYMAGFIAGYIFYKLKLYETKISRSTARSMFALSVLLFGSVLFPAVVFYTPQNEHGAWEAAVYAALQRFLWGAALSLLVISLASGKIRPVSRMLCWTPFVALGKLTYCAYLIHFTFQLIGLGKDRNPNYVTNYNVLLASTGESVFTFCMALIVYLMVEAPFRDIGRLLVIAASARARRKPRTPEANAVAEVRSGPTGFSDGGRQEEA